MCRALHCKDLAATAMLAHQVNLLTDACTSWQVGSTFCVAHLEICCPVLKHSSQFLPDLEMLYSQAYTLALLTVVGAVSCWWLLDAQKNRPGSLGRKRSADLHRSWTSILNMSWSTQPVSTPPHNMIKQGLAGLIGNTRLVRIASLSEATGCEILAKAEFLNPGGSVKDRVALNIVEEALQTGKLLPGGLITEGTAGSTGVSLALVAAALGCRCFVAMPDDAAVEKVQMLQALGAEVERVRPVSITHPQHHVNIARRRAAAEPGALFADQFENAANLRAHVRTGEEIWAQTAGCVHAFVCGAGTGGTIAGVSQALKGHSPHVQVYLADPPGSSLYNKVTRGVMFTAVEAEGRRLRNPFDTITEGVGLNRLTHNFAQAKIDGAVQASDQESVEMAAYLLRNDGLFIGSSSAVNCVGAVKVAQQLGPGHTIVTILCDGGQRHLSKFHNPAYLAQQGLTPQASGTGLHFISKH